MLRIPLRGYVTLGVTLLILGISLYMTIGTLTHSFSYTEIEDEDDCTCSW